MILAGASLLCFGFATIVSTLIAYSDPVNPLGLLLLAIVLFTLAGLFCVLSLTWYLVQWTLSVATMGVRKGRYRLGKWFEEFEEEYSTIRIIGLSTAITPPDPRSPQERAAESLTEVRTRYVDGHLTEREFEEELTTLLEVESEFK
ncbi:hypothetical protein [Natrinema salinisoli]|uniref:hypothetical protein n=1 Tax=Natrinema salinisoli TaxID=2878535 RepID=UPI001CF06BA7|nr:hypothetical protein [Natrinema salinisoli]